MNDKNMELMLEEIVINERFVNEKFLALFKLLEENEKKIIELMAKVK